MNIQSETLSKLNSWGKNPRIFGFDELRKDFMELTQQQIEAFNKDGYLFFPKLFTPEEVKKLNDAVLELYDRREAYNVREKGSQAVRTNFAAHLYSAPFARLGRHPRMVRPVSRCLVKSSTCTSSKLMGKWHLKVMFGNGTKTMALGSMTTWCQNQGRWMLRSFWMMSTSIMALWCLFREATSVESSRLDMIWLQQATHYGRLTINWFASLSKELGEERAESSVL